MDESEKPENEKPKKKRIKELLREINRKGEVGELKEGSIWVPWR